MKKMTLVFCSLLLMFSLNAVAEEKTYINGIDANYPPMAFDLNNQASGFDVESMNWIANKMGFKIIHKSMDWDATIPSLLADKIQMICSGMSISPERLEKVNFSNPYWTVSKVLVVPAGSSLTVDAIMGGEAKIGAQRGTNEAVILEDMKNAGKKFTIRFYDSGPQAIEDLLNGRIEAVAMDDLPAADAVSKGKAVKILGDFAQGDQFGVAINKNNKELLDIINQGYALLMADPYWEELKTKYNLQ